MYGGLKDGCIESAMGGTPDHEVEGPKECWSEGTIDDGALDGEYVGDMMEGLIDGRHDG